MSTRKIKDAIDLSTNEKVYYKSHAKATFMSDGRTVEDAILAGGSGGRTSVIDHGTEDTTFELTSGVIHKWGLVSSLTLTVPEDSEGVVSQYRVVFTAGANFSLTLPETMVWSGGEMPEFGELKTHELNIEGGRVTHAEFNVTDGEEVDYIENDVENHDYIMTDIVPQTGDTGFEVKAALYEAVTELYNSPAGARITNVNDTNALCLFVNGNYRLDWNKNSYTYGAFTLGQDCVFSKTGVALTQVNTLPIYVLASNENGAATAFGHMRVYYVTLYGSDGNPRAQLVPYKIGNVYGLKDKVSGKFYASVLGKLTGGYNE